MQLQSNNLAIVSRMRRFYNSTLVLIGVICRFFDKAAYETELPANKAQLDWLAAAP